MKGYLAQRHDLVKQYAWSFPAFKNRVQAAADRRADVDLGSLTEDETDALLEFAFERYYTHERAVRHARVCVAIVDRCKASGRRDRVPDRLRRADRQVLAACRCSTRSDVANERPAVVESPAVQCGSAATIRCRRRCRARQVTHLQCTPSMARMLLTDDTKARRPLALDH
jgi:hypothetical protein